MVGFWRVREYGMTSLSIVYILRRVHVYMFTTPLAAELHDVIEHITRIASKWIT